MSRLNPTESALRKLVATITHNPDWLNPVFKRHPLLLAETARLTQQIKALGYNWEPVKPVDLDELDELRQTASSIAGERKSEASASSFSAGPETGLTNPQVPLPWPEETQIQNQNQNQSQTDAGSGSPPPKDPAPGTF